MSKHNDKAIALLRARGLILPAGFRRLGHSLRPFIQRARAQATALARVKKLPAARCGHCPTDEPETEEHIMSDPIEIHPDGLRKSAVEFDGVADTTKGILDKLKSAAAAHGEPWGDDKNGKKFAECDKGYLKNRDGTFDSLSKLVEVFQDNANNLRDTAKTFEDNEKSSSS